MAIRKKKAAAKRGAKKSAAKKASTKPAPRKAKLSRRSSNRLANRPAGSGEPPPGPVTEASLERVIKQWLSIPNKRPRDYSSYPQQDLMDDAKEMAFGREDLELFEDKRTPITVRNFDWLDLIIAALRALGNEDGTSSAMVEVISEDMQFAMDAVVDARAALSRRAQASGVPLTLLSIPEEAYRRPHVLHTTAADACAKARQYLSGFNDVHYALSLIEDLEAAVDQLRELLDEERMVGVEDVSRRRRRAALKRLLFDALTHIAPWGRDVTAGDDTKELRYRLDKVFPSKPPKATEPVTPATPTTVIGGAPV